MNDYPKPPEKWFPLFGLTVVRKTDLLAATAFVLSLSTILYQFFQFIRGPDPNIYHPATVYVFFDKYANGVEATRIAGQISFTNGGQVGRSSVIQDVSANIKVAERQFDETWLSFAVVKRDNLKLDIDAKETAHPIVVDGGSAASHMVTFSPLVVDCPSKSEHPCEGTKNFLSPADFLSHLVPDNELKIAFNATILGASSGIQSRCKVTVTRDMIVTLAKNTWYAARCVSDRS